MTIGAASSGKTNPLRFAHGHPDEVLHATEEVLIELQFDKPMNLQLSFRVWKRRIA